MRPWSWEIGEPHLNLGGTTKNKKSSRALCKILTESTRVPSSHCTTVFFQLVAGSAKLSAWLAVGQAKHFFD